MSKTKWPESLFGLGVHLCEGVFGHGVAEMASSIGATVKTIDFEYDDIVHDEEKIREEIQKFNPKMVTIIHCETPSGTLNPLEKNWKNS